MNKNGIDLLSDIAQHNDRALELLIGWRYRPKRDVRAAQNGWCDHSIAVTFIASPRSHNEGL